MGRIVARYDYMDAKGKPRLRKTRREGKVMAWRSFDWQDARGNWHFQRGITDEQYGFSIKALYKLPEVIAALRVDVPVWWCEGEKDAENVAATGLVATTTPSTAYLWDAQAEWFTKFRTRSEVIVVCDQDEHGGWWGWERYSTLLRVGVDASRIYVVAPPWRSPFRAKGSDVSDVLEAGLSVGDLRSVDLDRLRDCATQYKHTRARTYMGLAPTPAGKASR